MKKLRVVLLVILVLTLPLGVYAATSDSEVATDFREFCGFGGYGGGYNREDLTEEQIAAYEEHFDEMFDLRKEEVQAMIEDGTITEDEAALWLERLDEMEAFHEENEGVMGRGFMGGGRGCGGGGYGLRR